MSMRLHAYRVRNFIGVPLLLIIRVIGAFDFSKSCLFVPSILLLVFKCDSSVITAY